MSHRTLIKVHGYIAVFFLPIAILYAVTGTFYIIGKSGSATNVSLEFQTKGGWPKTVDIAHALVNERLRDNGLPAAAENLAATGRAASDTEYYWRALTHSVALTKTGNETAKLQVQENSLYRQLVEIHKDHAGIFFTVIGFAFGIAMSILILSGSFMMFKSRLHRKAATWLLSSGTALCIVAYCASVFA